MRKIAIALLLAAMSSAQAAPAPQVLQGPPPPASPAAPIATISPSVYASSTVKDFLSVCGNDQGGCADEVGNALIDKMVFDGTADICLPGPDYAVGALKWLDTHPEVGTMPTEDGIYLALQKADSCV